MRLFEEIRRRNVHRVAIAYAAGAWLLIQVGDTVFPAYDLPESSLNILITLLVIGFLPALILSWLFEWTPEGLRRDSVTAAEAPVASAPGWLDRVIIVTLVIAVGYFAVDKFIVDPTRDAALVEAARQEGRIDARVRSYGDRSIAVLPFVNMSSDPEQEYFSDGVAEEILNLLAQIEELRVISRSSAFAFKGEDIQIPRVAEALDVAHVLEGSVRRSGNRLRITAQLIDARTDTHLWSETYERELGDVFAIQDEIAAAVTEQLRITIFGAMPQIERTDPEAYTLYLHARYLFNTFVPANQAHAEQLVDQVLEAAPEYMPALILKLRTMIKDDENLVATPEFNQLVDRIVAIDPDNERVHSLRSWVALYVDGDVATAARFLERALQRASADPEFLRATSTILMGIGLTAETIAVQTYVVDRDPTCVQCRYLLASSYRDAGMFDEAEAMMQSAVDLFSDDSPFRYALARIWLLNGKPTQVLEWIEREGGADTLQLEALALMVRHDLGSTVESRAAVKNLAARWGDEHYLAAVEALAWTGENDLAFERLETLPTGEMVIRWRNPFFSRLRSDSRWQALLSRHGLAAEQLAALDIRITLPHGVTIVSE